MRIAISGSSGLIGNALKGSLTADEHEVVTLVRHEAGPGEIGWNPDTGTLDAAALEGFDAIVNLNGAPIAGRRWSAGYKKVLLASRTNATRTLAETIKRLDEPPRSSRRRRSTTTASDAAPMSSTRTSRPAPTSLHVSWTIGRKPPRRPSMPASRWYIRDSET